MSANLHYSESQRSTQHINQPLAQHTSEVNINDASEMRHWIEHWDVSEAELRKTVAEVGTEVDALRVALGK